MLRSNYINSCTSLNSQIVDLSCLKSMSIIISHQILDSSESTIQLIYFYEKNLIIALKRVSHSLNVNINAV